MDIRNPSPDRLRADEPASVIGFVERTPRGRR